MGLIRRVSARVDLISVNISCGRGLCAADHLVMHNWWSMISQNTIILLRILICILLCINRLSN